MYKIKRLKRKMDMFQLSWWFPKQGLFLKLLHCRKKLSCPEPPAKPIQNVSRVSKQRFFKLLQGKNKSRFQNLHQTLYKKSANFQNIDLCLSCFIVEINVVSIPPANSVRNVSRCSKHCVFV